MLSTTGNLFGPLGNVCFKDIIFTRKLLLTWFFVVVVVISVWAFFWNLFCFSWKVELTHTAFFFEDGEIFHYEITQHSHTISRSLVLCLRFISRTISANTSLTFVRCLALASTKEQPHIWAKAWKKKKGKIYRTYRYIVQCTMT